MFWRQNYTDIDANDDYFQNKERTNYTYAESRSYRVVPNELNCSEPYLMRNNIRKIKLNTELDDFNLQDNDVMALRKSSTNRITTSQTNTPNQQKNYFGNSDRVLRSRINITHRELNSSNIPFVKEHRESEIYKFGLLNTNTNNSGPDEVINDNDNDKKSKKPELFNYDLSGDEGMGSDTVDSDNGVGLFGTNNANSIRPSIQHKEKTKTHWFQKNMFGLPNDESDEVNQDLSGVISGDEQYDIAPYQQSNLNQKSKWIKSQTRKSHRQDKSNTNRKLENIFCSPVAMISLLVEWIVQTIITVVRRVIRHTKLITCHSTLTNWLMMPFYLPKSLIRNTVAAFAYASDRLFGTSFRRRLNMNNRNRNWFINNLFSLFWLLVIATIVYILLHFYLGDNTISSDTQSSFTHDFNLFQYVYRFVGNNCMKKNNCCNTNWEMTWRFMFCLFSLPARMIISDTERLSPNFDNTESPKLLTNNISNLEEILEKFKERLEFQDKKLISYNTKILNLETNFNKSTDIKFLEMERSIESVSKKLSDLKLELEKLILSQSKTQEFKNLAQVQINNFVSKYSSLEKSKQKLEKDILSLNNLINSTEKQTSSNLESTNKLQNLIDELKIDLSDVKNKVIEMDFKTSTDELSKQSVLNSAKLKEEIIHEFSEEMKKVRAFQDNVINKLNQQMSHLERTLNENQSKLVDKYYVNDLLISHIESLKESIKDEVNITMWRNLTNHINDLLNSKELKIENYKASNLFSTTNEKPCNCISSNSRCSRGTITCVRIHQVRQLLKDALNLFAADKIGMADFALESAGGTIATTRCTETYTDRASTLTIFGIPLMRLTNSPRTIIQPSLNPGECWPMKGSRGAVVVQLSAQVRVTAVSIDHIPKSLSPSESIDSAIHDFEIKALNNESDKIGESLGNFTYLLDSDPVQTFYIQNPVETKLIELIVNSNYGNKEYTCIYRMRVHGKLIQF